jgi:putative phosphoserine phosphatase/1-acylglycerol-3-phosphate O-acyltransferase
MEPYRDFTRHLARGARGTRSTAFFDVDDTLIHTHSIGEVFKERLSRRQVGVAELADLLNMSARYVLKIGDFEDAMAASVRNIAGHEVAAYHELGEKVFRDRLAPVIFPEMKAVVRAHRQLGHDLVLVTSATRFQVEALARYLGIEHILCTELAHSEGRFTGEIDGPPCYGAGKLRAARDFAVQRRMDLADCWFYSNGSEDLPLLDAVGHPVAVNPDRRLLDVARQRGWTVLQPTARGSTGPLDVARTLLTFASTLPAVALGLPLRFAGLRREAANVSISSWADAGAAISGLKLIVDGERHLWSHRPAVFLFNHQSAMDTLICARLIRQDAVAVAKQEIRRQPFMGPALEALGAVFIDREGSADPRDVLRPALDALERGSSVIIAPEGTRSRDEQLGEFKKGAFHLAMQAGVPLVPMVIHNALDALPNHSMVVRPAEVKVTVLPPIPTTGWTLPDVARHVRRVRQAYLKVLRPYAHRVSSGDRAADAPQ